METFFETPVEAVLERKGHDVWFVSPDASLLDALLLLEEKDIGALLVMKGDDLVGIWSERDFARWATQEGKLRGGEAPLHIPVRELMTEQVITVGPKQTMARCEELMTEKRVRHLPVVEKNRVIGVISIGDVVKETNLNLRSSIKQLTDFVSTPR